MTQRLYPLYIFDLDGTLYRGTETIPGAPEAVAELRRRGAKIRYLTNNSSQTRAFYAQKLRGMGFEAHEDEVESSATGTAAHLRGKARRAFVVGMPGLVQTLREANIEVVNAGDDGVVGVQGEAADAVVSGICRDPLSYGLLTAAMEQIRAGAQFVATNADPTFPNEGGRLSPGAGAIVAALQTCAEVAPFVVGKPNPFLVQHILQEVGVAPKDALCVGDRMDTDIESGRRAGCDVHLVLTGVTRTAPEGVPSSADLSGLL